MPTAFDTGPYSGINTKKLIDDLVKHEKIPQKRYRRQQNEMDQEIKALGELQKKTKILQNSLRALRSFNSGFGAKTLKTFPEGIISGTAGPKAKDGKHSIKVLKIARRLKIASKKVSPKKKVPKGVVELDGQKETFAGGNLNAFKNFLNSSFSDKLNAQVIKINGKEAVLVIEHKKVGKLFDFKDPNGILGSLDILGSGSGQAAPAADNKELENPANEKETVNFADLDFGTTATDRVAVAGDKNSITMTGDGQVKVKFKLKARENFRLKALNTSAKAGKLEEDKAPAKVNVGPKDSLNIKGITVETYNVDRVRQKEEKKYSGNDYGVIVNGQKYSMVKTNKLFVPLESEISEVTLYNNSPQVTFKKLEFIYTPVPKEEQGQNKEEEPYVSNEELQKRQEGKYKNIITRAQKAELELNGIKIEREKNQDLTDVIEGVSLNLQREDENPVALQVDKNANKAKEKILDFVKKYNDLLEYAQLSARHTEVKEVGQFNKVKKESGVLVNNTAVRGLLNGLKRRSSDAYPAVRKPYVKMLSMIGISTGKVGSSWESIRFGFLQVDQQKLEEMLTEHPEAVEELFVVDSNGDNRPDHGFALKTERYLRPYTTDTRGIISEQIKNKKNRITDLDKMIAKNEEASERKREQLKRKFGYMEGKVGRQKAIGKMLRNRLQQK